MTAIAESPAPAAPAQLSRRLVEPLTIVAARQRILTVLRAAFQFIVLAAASWLIITLLLGTLRELPPLAAIPLAILAWAILLAGLFFFIRAWRRLRRRNLSSAARLVDLALPATQERISSAVEISQETDPRFKGSPELVACLVRQAEKDADALDPHAVVSGASVLRWFGILSLLTLVWFVFLIAKTPNVLLGLQRTLRPWSAAPPLPTAILQIEPGSVAISQGDTLTIALTVLPPSGSASDAELTSIPRASISRRFGNSPDNELTSEMERTGPRTFRTILPNVEQSFSYIVRSENAQSPLFNVTVQPRPATGNIELTYTYPAYTKRKPRTDNSHDGAIDALVGTRVRITVQATQPLMSAAMAITDNAPNPGTLALAPLPESPQKYAAEFTVIKSTQYRLQLINEQRLENKDDQPRPIVARLDAVPQIQIASPTTTLKVRPDDAVPLQYLATDDFGLTKLEALLQFDDVPGSPQTVFPIPLTTDDAGAKAEAKWPLALSEALRALPPTAQPKRLTYQLRATDNRQPTPQTGLSARQVLEIDRGAAPLAQRQEAEALRSLAEAIKKAAADLQQADAKLKDLQNSPAEKSQELAAEARKKISEARKDLTSATEKSSDTRLADAATQAWKIADNPMRKAEENAADAQLAADQPDPRNKSAAQSQAQIAESQKQLSDLAQRLSDTAKNQPLAQDLERLEQQQRQLADAMARNPDDPALQQQQKQLQKQLDDIIKKNPDLQKPAADAHQSQIDDLVRRIQDLERSQQPHLDALQNQADADTQKARDLPQDIARRQEELNRQIEQFRYEHNVPLKQASAKTPDKSQLDPIVKDLKSNKLQSAAQSQRAAGVQLDEAADRLDTVDKRNDNKPPPANEKDAEAAARANDLQEQTRQLGRQIADAEKNHNPPTRPSDPANKEASKLADELKRQAQQQSLSRSPAVKQAAQEAAKAADAAKRDAQSGNARPAQERLATAAGRLADALKSTQPNPSAPDAPGKAAQAAKQAHDFADRQRQLADETAQAAKSQSDAAESRARASEAAREQQGLADQIDQAARQAEDLQQQTEGKAPDTSQRAAKAANSLKQSAKSQRSAAKSTQQNDAPAASAQQNKSADEIADAEETITGQPSPSRQRRSPQTANSQSPRQSSDPSQESRPQTNENQPPDSAPNQSQKQDAGQPDNSAQSAKGQGRQSGKIPGAGQFQNQASNQSNGQNPGQGQPSPNGSPSNNSSPGAPGNGSQSNGIAQSVQAARNAQSQAASGDPAAARRAAEQLGQARQLAGNQPAQPGDSASNGNPQNSSGANGKPAPNPSPSGAPLAGTGTSAGASRPSAPLPKPIEELGLSPSDWAKLSPPIQDQLLHSARQSGPPSYRDMIRNYYSRIAQLQPDNGTTNK